MSLVAKQFGFLSYNAACHTHGDIKTLLTNLDVNGWKSKLLLVDTDEVHNIGQLVHSTQHGHGTGDSLNNAVTETKNRKSHQCTEFIKLSLYWKYTRHIHEPSLNLAQICHLGISTLKFQRKTCIKKLEKISPSRQ